MKLRETIPDAPHALRYHGGNINAARSLFPHAPEPWIDLSTGINPVPYPIGAIPPAAWTRLPEADDLAALEAVAHVAYGAPPTAHLVAAPGTQALIQWLPRAFPARRVGVLGFTYQEHEACWRGAGANITTVTTLSDLAAFDVGVVVNPNNPDGELYALDTMAEIARILAQRGGRLVVDEAFMDVVGPQRSLVPRLPAAGAIVLRSFGKAYGLAGLRLGFAVASPEDCTRLRSAVGPWAVSGPAIEIGRRALMDNRWLTEAAARLQSEADRLDRWLQSAGFEIAGGTALFRLACRSDALAWFERLCQAGILTRPYQLKPRWLRFGIPHGPVEWNRLQLALARQ
jgi:cobalamin biosynthetic protein CobC